jgi:hypothetical protein
MNIENKTNEEIKAHIVKMCDSYNKTGKDLYLKIKAECEAELQRRAQKKAEPQPIEKTGQLEQPKRPEKLAAIESKEERKQRIAHDQEPKSEAEEIQLAMQQRDEMLKEKGWKKIREALPKMTESYDGFIQAPQVAQKPTIVIHFAGKPLPGQYTRGELRDVARQNFTLVVKSATFQRCLKAGNFSELWTLRLYYNLHLAVQGLKKLEGLESYTMEDLFIGYWNYHKDKQEAGRVLAEYLKQPKPE